MIDWKSLYAELVEQLDRQQNRSKKRQALLTAGLKSSARFARGLDKRVDKSLLALQALLRQDKLKNVDLAVAIDTLEKQSEQSVVERNKNLKRAAVAIKNISSQTRSLSISSQTHQLLKKIENELDRKDNRFDQLPEHLEALMLQHRSAMRQSKKRSGRSIWRQWLSKEQEEPLTPHEDENEEEEEVVEEHTDETECEEKVAQDPSDKLPTSAKKSLKNVDLRSVVRNQFTTLLQQLGRSDTTTALQTRLNDKLSINDIADLTTRVCDTSLDTIHQERQANYAVIKRLNSRLSVSMNQIDACWAIEESSQAVSREFQLAIQNGCSSIEASLANANSLDELKQHLTERIGAMKVALATHESQGAQQGMTASLESLSQQMTHVQDMNRATLFQLESQAKETTTDRDTGLPNRAAFRLIAPIFIEQSRRSNSPLIVSVCMIDQIQSLKSSTEPARLSAFFAALADVYRQALRDSDRIFRLGENEFVFLLPATDGQAATILLDGLRQTVAKASVAEQRITISLGFVACGNSDTAESALARAKPRGH